MDTDFKSKVAAVSEKIQSYTYPLLRVGANATPALFVSCVFLKLRNSTFMVSAAHAIRDGTSGLFTRGDGHLIDVVGQARVSRSEGKDHFDIGAIRVDEQLVKDERLNVVPENLLSMMVEVKNPHSRAICGFPVSMNKSVNSLDRKTKTFTGKCYSYFGFAEFNGDYSRFEKSRRVHIGLEYLPGTDDSGRHLSSPPWPRGISGGGAWLVPDLSRPDLVFLEGIFIEAYRHTKQLFCFSTRIEHAVDFIFQTHNNSPEGDALKPCASG